MVCGLKKTNLSAGRDYWKLTSDSIFHYLYQVSVLTDDSQLAGHAIEEKRPMGQCYHSFMKYGFVLLKIHRSFFIFIILVGLRLTKHVIGQYQSLIGGP
jgi:hypothetical protein